MKNRPFKELSDQALKKINEIATRAIRKPKTSDEYNSLVKTTLYNLNNHLDLHKGSLSDIVDQKDNQNGNGWVKNLSELRVSYNQVYTLNQELMNHEKAIHRIERKAHIRSLIFRFLTTLLIGFGVMLVYFSAQKLGINMPLLRVSA